ncbi:putative transcription factor bZIP family [Helianthus annuus]|nr:putative transcription factor bZIP family [Helianthus annuus]
MSQILSELFVCGCMINSSYWRRTHLVQSFSVWHNDVVWWLQMDQREQRRMISNRESAKRSRMKKQKHLNDLMTQLSQLRSENNRVVSSIGMITQHYVSLEAENSVLAARVTELGHRLRSLNEIIEFMKQQVVDTGSWFPDEHYGGSGADLIDSVSYVYSCQPIMTSIDMNIM